MDTSQVQTWDSQRMVHNYVSKVLIKAELTRLWYFLASSIKLGWAYIFFFALSFLKLFY